MTNAQPGEGARRERRGLILSVWGAVGMAALGIGFAMATHSQAVLLDGLFSLIGAAVAVLTLRVSTLVRKPDDECFHFGYAAYEPMLNLSKGLLIAAVGLFALVASVDAILRGGRLVRGDVAVVYAVIAATGCLFIALIQRRMARRTESPLLDVDSRNWLMDGLISGAVAVAFLIMVLLEGTALEWFLPYVDPAVVIALVLLSAPLPIGIVRANWNQLLGRTPGPDIQQEARSRVDESLKGVPDVIPHLRLLQTGRAYYVQIYLQIGPLSGLDSLEDLDRLREQVCRSVLQDSPDIGLDVIFTRDAKWIRRTTPSGSVRIRT